MRLYFGTVTVGTGGDSSQVVDLHGLYHGFYSVFSKMFCFSRSIIGVKPTVAILLKPGRKDLGLEI